MTLEEAQEGLNGLPLPEVADGDVIWYPGGKAGVDDLGFRFVYQNGNWVHSPEE